MAAALPWISAIGGGASSLKGATKPKTATSSFNQTTNSEQQLTPRQQKLDKNVINQLLYYIKAGPTVLQGDRNTLRGQVNASTEGARQNLSQTLAARGLSDSGAAGAGATDLEINRLKGFQTGEATLRDQAWARFANMLGQARAALQPRYSTSTTSGTSQNTQPGENPYSAAGRGLSDFSSLLFLKPWQQNAAPTAYSTQSTAGYPASVPPICWLAMAAYGDQDWRVHLIRSVLAERARVSMKWLAVVELYAAVGRPLGAIVRRVGVLKRMTRQAFEPLVLEAING